MGMTMEEEMVMEMVMEMVLEMETMEETTAIGRIVARECTYQDFMKCQPLSFKGTKGVVGLIRWSEKMETVFHISDNCPERYQVKYATCTLLDSALTWWRELLKLMTKVYYPRNKIQKMETELWNLSVKNNDMTTYTQ
ncbi:hypothetical protein Tco_0274080, partial [Tanacetum coccineum]